MALQTGQPTARAVAQVASWARTYGGQGFDYVLSAQQTSDGGFIAVGYTVSSVGGSSEFWVIRLDSSGNIEWQKTYGMGEAFSVQQTLDGGYIVAGWRAFTGTWLLKIDPMGNIVWQKAYGGGIGFSVQQTSDGGYIVAGGYGFGVIRVDAAGNVIWQKNFRESGFPNAWSVRQTSDGGFIAVGQTTSFGTGVDINAWVLKLDAMGNAVWQKTYGGPGNDLAFSVDQTMDGDFMVAGQSNSFSGGFTDAWVFKLDPSGNIVWQKAYGGRMAGAFSVALSVAKTSDNGSVVAGYTSGFGNGLNDAWVFKLDRLGGVVWQRTFGGSGYDLANSVAQTQDGGFVAAGYFQVQPVRSDNKDALILRLGPDGSICHCHLMASSNATVTVTNATVTATTVAGSNPDVSTTTTNSTFVNTFASARIRCFAPQTP
jgi:hypothetical protein